MRNIYDWSFLCKMVMVYLANQISDTCYEKLREIFIEIDTDKNGYIDFKEFCQYFCENEACEEIQEIRDVFESIDLNHDDRIEYREFIAANMRKTIDQQIKSQPSKIKGHLINAFIFFDVDGSGYITEDNIKKFLCPVDAEHCSIDFVIGEVVQDGKIDIMEFISLIQDKCSEDEKICE